MTKKFGPQDGKLKFTAGNVSLAALSQTVSLVKYRQAIDAGRLFVHFSCWIRTDDRDHADGSSVLVEYLDQSGRVVAKFQSPVYVRRTEWIEVGDAKIAPNGAQSVRVTMTSARLGGGSFNQAFFDSLSLKAIELSELELKNLTRRIPYGLQVRTSVDTINASRDVPPDQAAVEVGRARPSNSVGMRFVWCPPGRSIRDAETQHSNVLTRGFWIGQTEVTQSQWQKMWALLSIDKSADQPFYASRKHFSYGCSTTRPSADKTRIRRRAIGARVVISDPHRGPVGTRRKGWNVNGLLLRKRRGIAQGVCLVPQP